MEAASWTNCRAEFAFDGGLIDLLVPGAGPDDWVPFWSALRAGPFALSAFQGGEPIPLPDSVAWALAERDALVMLSVNAGPVTANCHFLGFLEFDIDPREVASESAFEAVLELMRLIAKAVQLPAFAVPEGGSPANSFLRVSPCGEAEFLPTSPIGNA